MRAIATAWNNAFRGDRMALGVDTTDDVVVNSTSTGVVLKDTNGHYWRLSVSTAGALVTTDLGTTKP